MGRSDLTATRFEHLVQSTDKDGEALAAGIDGDMRDCAVKRITRLEQLVEPRTRVRSLQERAILVVARAV